MTSQPARIDQSYRGLFSVPQLSRVLASMIVARVASAMVGVAIVLFTLDEYDSPALAGLVTLAYILPGILVSPIAGALLDRHGRVRLIILDYIVAGSALGIIAFLALSDRLPAGLLVLIAAVASLTSILSATGLRSLFPIMVPKHLWERVNAIDFERVHRGDDPRPTDRRGPCDGCRRPSDAGDHRRDDAAGHGSADRRP